MPNRFQWGPFYRVMFKMFLKSLTADCLNQQPRLQNFPHFVDRCARSGFAPVPVAWDGNCLVWSLRCFHVGWECHGDFETPHAERRQKIIRKMVVSAWESCKSDSQWQQLFVHFNPDGFKEDQDPCVTPKAQGTSAAPDFTPPPPEGKKRRKKVQQAGDTKPVPLATKKKLASPGLKRPSKRNKQTLTEPDAPDVEEAFHKCMMAEEEFPEFPDFSKVADISEEHFQQMAEEVKVYRQRRRHAREWKSRTKTTRELNELALSQWLGRNGLSYAAHSCFHRQNNVHGKSKFCQQGGWVKLKEAMLGGPLAWKVDS